jgi:hypothetical protein
LILHVHGLTIHDERPADVCRKLPNVCASECQLMLTMYSLHLCVLLQRCEHANQVVVACGKKHDLHEKWAELKCTGRQGISMGLRKTYLSRELGLNLVLAPCG